MSVSQSRKIRRKQNNTNINVASAATTSYLGDREELSDNFHVGNKLLVNVERRFALFTRHLKELGCNTNKDTIPPLFLYNYITTPVLFSRTIRYCYHSVVCPSVYNNAEVYN